MPYQTLTPIRVIDASTGIAGPYAGKMLADYGADVIKLELPTAPDHSRDSGAFPGGIPHAEKSALYLHLNAGKKGITLDPSTGDGRRIFTNLAAQSDVILESFRPGRMAEWGVGYHDLREVRADIVMTSVTPYGQSGPHKDYEYTELTIFASGGAMHREGLPDREPLRYGAEIAQYFSGTIAAAATMIALFGVAIHGEGEWIDISMQECFAGHPHQVGRRTPWIYGNEPDPRKPPRRAAAGMREPYAVGSFRCKDGYVSFLPLGSRMWPQLARMIDRADLITDPRFSTPTTAPSAARSLKPSSRLGSTSTRAWKSSPPDSERACPAPPSWKPRRRSKTRTSATAATSSTSSTPTPARSRTLASPSASPTMTLLRTPLPRA